MGTQRGVDEVVLDKLKEWLRSERLHGDVQKLIKTISIIKRLDIEVTEVERGELRELIKDCFGVSDVELQGLMPSEMVAAVDGWEMRDGMPAVNGGPGGYLELNIGQESPESFHLFALLACVGAALGRGVRLDMTFFKVWPNLSVVLTGPAGGPRKTTACDIAYGTVRAAFKGWTKRAIMDATPPAMVEELGTDGKRDSIGFLYAPEFRNFFPDQQFMAGAIPLITRLLDNPDFHNVSRILRQGGALKNTTLSMLGGSTLDWLGKLPQDIQGGGFLTRVLLVHEERIRGVQARPVRGRSEIAAKVRAWLGRVDRYGRGDVRLSPEAEAWLVDYYKKLRSLKNIHPRMVLFYNRKQQLLLKVALIMALPRRLLTKGDLEMAEQLVTWTEGPLPDVYRVIGMSKSGELTKAVLGTLKAFGGKMTWAQLSREMKGILNARDFRMAIDTLAGAGQINEIRNPGEHVLVLRELSLVE